MRLPLFSDHTLAGDTLCRSCCAVQEKQRQQDQQLQRHLTRPPPQYQDQPGQNANQNAFAQASVSQFTG